MRRMLYERTTGVVIGVAALVVVLGAAAALAVPGSIQSSFDRLSELTPSEFEASRQGQPAILQPDTGETFTAEEFSPPEENESPPAVDQAARTQASDAPPKQQTEIQAEPVQFVYDNPATKTGTVEQLKYSPSGNKDGFYFADGTAVDFPPGYDASGVVSEGSEVEVGGVRREGAFGETVFEVRTLTNMDNGDSIGFDQASRQTPTQAPQGASRGFAEPAAPAAPPLAGTPPPPSGGTAPSTTLPDPGLAGPPAPPSGGPGAPPPPPGGPAPGGPLG